MGVSKTEYLRKLRPLLDLGGTAPQGSGIYRLNTAESGRDQ